MCTGACLASAAQHWGDLGLGPTPRGPPAMGLPLWLRNHLVHDLLCCGRYTCAYAYDMRVCMHDLQKL